MRTRLTFWWKNKKTRFVMIGIGLLFLLVTVTLLFFLLRHKEGPSVAGKDQGVSLTDYAGTSVEFNSFLGILGAKPLIVFFWATWCPYCTEEFVRLAEVKQRYGERVQVVAINRGENSQEAKQFTDALQNIGGMVFLLDSNDLLFKKFGGYAVPETIFINTYGEEVVRARGPMSAADIDAAAAQLVK